MGRDASIYFFKSSFRNVAGGNMTCECVPAVRLHIFACPVSILLEEIVVRGQKVPVADWTVMEGQKTMLTCVPTCAANLNSNPGYIWYKNRLQLNGSRANSPFLSLDPISNEDTVCAMIGYKDLPSSAVKTPTWKLLRWDETERDVLKHYTTSLACLPIKY